MNYLPSDYGLQINLLHSLFVGPLLMWTGYKLNTGTSLSNIEKLIMLVTGLAVLVYHGIKAFKKQQANLNIMKNYGFQVNILHLFFIGPLVAWSGWKLYRGKRVTDLEKTTLLFLGVVAFVYHIYQTLQKYKFFKTSKPE